MNDFYRGETEGLMIALLIAEKNKKHPQWIQREIVEILQNVSRTIACDAVDRIRVKAGVWAKAH